jgi:hypothetical protein
MAPGIAAARIVFEDLRGRTSSDDVAALVSQMAPGVRSGARAAPSNGTGTPPGGSAPDAPTSPPPSTVPRLVFHVLEDRTVVFAVDAAGTIRAHVAPIGRAALRDMVGELRRRLRVDEHLRGVGIDAPSEGDSSGLAAQDSPDEQLRSLYDRLIAPITAGLPGKGTSLVIEPHDALWLLPFAAMRAPDGSRLIERWPLVEAASLQTLQASRRAPATAGKAKRRALVVGDPLSGRMVLSTGASRMAFDPLPGARTEARRVKDLLGSSGSRLLVGSQADLESVIRLSPDPDIIHLATHAVAYDDDPLGSFVILAD